MNSKNYVFHYTISIAFILYICIPAFFMNHQNESLVEKRRLSSFPVLTSLREGLDSFPTEFEKFFNDHFGFRDELVYIYNWLTYKIGVSPTSKVIVGQNGWLFLGGGGAVEDYRNSEMFTEDELSRWKTHLEMKFEALQAKGIDYIFVIAPSKSTVYGEHMPARFRKFRSQSRCDQLVSYMRSSEVPILDLRPVMVSEKKNMPLFFKTDTHWNDFGAGIAQYAIGKHLHSLYPDVHPVQYDSTDFLWVEPDEAGDLALMMRLQRVLQEVLPDKKDILPKVEPRFLDPAVYDIDDKWGFFTTDNPKAPDKRVLVFRDSFFTALQPYISQYFRSATYASISADFVRLEKMIHEIPCNLVIEERAERFLKKVPRNFPGEMSDFYQAAFEKNFQKGQRILHLPDKKKPNALTPLNEVHIASRPQGFKIVSSGEDPYFLLPPFNVSRNHYYILKINLSAPEGSEGQIFYRTVAEDYYSEKKSIVIRFRKGGNKFFILLNGRTLKGQIRIDPGNTPGEYWLKKVEIIETSKKGEI